MTIPDASDTICAIATAQGGAIGIVRVSGKDALAFADKLFEPVGKSALRLTSRQGGTTSFGRIVDDKCEIVDEVIASVFRSPHSYTGEDSVEFSCHGSPYILQKVLSLLIENGCRMAEPGEFTRRAFLNGKMDLSQAEAVAEIIASTSAATHRMAVNQMRGTFSRCIAELRERLLRLTSLMELELDFSDHEDLEFADRDLLRAAATEIESTINILADSFTLGNVIKNGIPVAIVGETNVGKSTLLNTLAGDDRAIVSDVHGTTRDVIEDIVNIGGAIFRLIDTAGIRETADEIESLGVERAFKAVEKSQIVVLVCEFGVDCSTLNEKLYGLLKEKKVILVVNKCDKADKQSSFDRANTKSQNKTAMALDSVAATDAEILSLSGILDSSDDKVCLAKANGWAVVPISAKYGTNIEQLKQLIAETAAIPKIKEGDVMVANARHYEALKHAGSAINKVISGLNTGSPTDILCLDLRQCIHNLGEITGGEITSQETLNNIFSHFCVGK